MNISLILTVAAFFLCAGTTFTPDKNKYEAVIVTEQKDNMLTIKSMFENNSSEPVNFSYRFKSIRKSTAGTSAINQGGNAAAAPNQTITLSQTSVSVSNGDSYTLELEILDGNTVVAHSKISVPE